MDNKYIKSFDLLRVVALFSVLNFHLMEYFVPSGYLGVVIFFVLAGFLTMRQLIDNENGTLELGKNKIKYKICKLYPALLVIIFLVTIIIMQFFNFFIRQYPIDAISSVLSINNYAQIMRNETYFEAMNNIKPLTHIWALSLEMQFYIFFYLIVCPFYNKHNNNKYLLLFIMIFIISISISIYLLKNNSNFTRIYYGFDTRISTFLVGCIVAIVADKITKFKYILNSNIVSIKLFNIITKAIIIVLMSLIIIFTFFRYNGDYRIMMVINIYSILVGILLVILYIHHCNNLKSIISENNNIFDKIITYFVKRSYIMYLIHYPIIIFANRFIAHINVDINIYYIIMLSIIVFLTEVLYQLINSLFYKHCNQKLSNIIMILLLIVSVILLFYIHCNAGYS